jgi:hypothetical protein
MTILHTYVCGFCITGNHLACKGSWTDGNAKSHDCTCSHRGAQS